MSDERAWEACIKGRGENWDANRNGVLVVGICKTRRGPKTADTYIREACGSGVWYAV